MHANYIITNIYDKVFMSGLSKFCGRLPLKNLKGYGMHKQTIFFFLHLGVFFTTIHESGGVEREHRPEMG